MMARRTFLQSSAAAMAQTSGKTMTTSVMLWTLKGTFEQKLEAAAKSGIESVELVAEHVNWSDQQIAAMKKLARSMKLGMDTILATPDWGKRRVWMVRPDDRDAFLADVRQAVVFAQKLEIPQIILMSGNEVQGLSREQQWASLLEGAKRAADLAAKGNVTLVVEPLNNKVDHKGFFLTNCVDGLRLVKEVGNPHVKLLFDIYHEQVQIGNVTRTIHDAWQHTAIFHIADNPGRNDPGTGEMNYGNIYKAIRKTGYTGYITMEYLPLGDQVASLSAALKGWKAS
jgi:hydroxypyruvate isomerase